MKTIPIVLLLLAATSSRVSIAAESQATRRAISKAIKLLERGSAGTLKNRMCFTCHGQAMPAIAFAEARLRGFKINEHNFQQQVDRADEHLAKGKANYLMGKGQGGRVDTAGYALWTLEVGNRPPSETTAAVAEYVLQSFQKSGYWRHSSNRPPSEASDFTTTYLALRALGVYAIADQQDRVQEQYEGAEKWLLEKSPQDTEDRVFQLRAFHYLNADEKAQGKLADELIAQQQADGGWKQKPDMPTDAYATGSTLVGLVKTGRLSVNDDVYQRGMKFLLNTQQEDGSWLVESRSKPFQKYFETGFPHGKHQFISTSATAWATLALALSLPIEEPPEPTD